MDKATMTGPQQKVIEILQKHGAVEGWRLKQLGADLRAANNLVNSRVVTLTGGVYRLREQKKAQGEEAPSTQRPRSRREEPASEPASEPTSPVQEAAAPVQEPVAEPAPVTVESEPSTKPEGKKAAKGAKGAKAAKATADAAKPSKPAKPEKPAINPTGKCLCGCGTELGDKRRFAIGHDAKLHSLVLKVFRGKAQKDELPATDATRSYLQTAPWMTDEIREALSL